MALEMSTIGNDTELGIILNRDFLSLRTHYIEVGPDKICLPGRFEKYYEGYKNFKVHDDDVFILAFPKTGSRWTQELAWLLLNDLDYDAARDTMLYIRSPLLELNAVFDDGRIPLDHLTNIVNSPSPRCIRTHLHWSMLPHEITSGEKEPKIIVVLRGIEDTCVSLFHQSNILEGYTGTFDDFCKLFLGGKVPNGPYWKHVLGMWEQRNRRNIMFITYKEMLDDLETVVRNVAAFLGKHLSDDQVQSLVEYLHFDNLKKCKGFNMDSVKKIKETGINPFIRSGKVDGHKNIMLPDVIEEFKKQREANLKGTGLILE
ncbi:hypothetical protein FQA39_LY06521 [Lamprigera yunnana]|nr:hypothetical protein FQA39_LY06521 [Lamprigera yunnana]